MGFKSAENLIGFEYIFLIIFLIVSLVLVSWYKKRLDRSTGKQNSKLKVLEKAYLDNKTKVFVVEYENQKHFVVSNSSSISISPKLDD